jgi:hypothetical protein
LLLGHADKEKDEQTEVATMPVPTTAFERMDADPFITNEQLRVLEEHVRALDALEVAEARMNEGPQPATEHRSNTELTIPPHPEDVRAAVLEHEAALERLGEE